MDDGPAEQHLALGRAFEEIAAWLRRSPRTDVSATGLSVLDRLDTTGPQRVTDLAAAEGVTQPATTALVNRLEESGWVAREPDPDDGRAQRVRLTEDGHERLHRHRADRSRRIAERLAALDPADQAALERALPALRHLVAVPPRDR
ncbi:MarR family winged helix-turn-helix transcriptional regulator [Amnibacterium endophyticum]|uniref:MarR family winged helix-turn-helix transcriptional regulator n=1 Tax=Amnibacterium endophyticum TaxID=2109337 RepID=A0ABW4LES6_9MICO